MRIFILLILFLIPVRSVYAVYYPFDYAAVTYKATEQQIQSFVSSLPSTHTKLYYLLYQYADNTARLNVFASDSELSFSVPSPGLLCVSPSSNSSVIHQLKGSGVSQVFPAGKVDIADSSMVSFKSGVYTNTPPAPDPEPTPDPKPTPTPDPTPVPVPGGDDDDDGLGGKSCDGNIIAEFLRIALAINLWFLSKLPTLSLPDQVVSTLDDYFSVIDGIGQIVPLSHFFSAISFLIVVYNFRFFITLWNFIVSKIPFIGG